MFKLDLSSPYFVFVTIESVLSVVTKIDSYIFGREDIESYFSIKEMIKVHRNYMELFDEIF